ncbi:MAG: Uma2 family endonuclease [Synechococcales cyanobacterium RM1_1_8]|nr:Uma2 family endonuclease [Synechococcales cyanobacterium RM1_1_8]
MVQAKTKPILNIWTIATWSEFLDLVEDPAHAKAKVYYFDGLMKVETMGVGPAHASDNSILHIALTLFCALKGIPLKGLVNASFRQPGAKEAQPDLSYYLGERVAFAPKGSSIANLDEGPGPDLAVEIADSSLGDDLGRKRLLYEALGIPEYWVVDVGAAEIVAFAIADGGSRRIAVSQVLPGLGLSVLEAALEMARQQDDSQVTSWLMQQFQG